ncbi:hypothetical protein SAMN04488515_2715 [Cognatiyoonia koreensis]|uniref:Permuted papain-like amidase enzyme, YaeF/YiiX, C92 family n=1 Tax=Cognatiyoonia koreensis TaxID=364200 RepID=A0A1I0RHV1_9RHOB|nr:hypothetical protein [Cognatiyoonia koreensis]SEW40507.1 hypothetical protein SAMN04488515_2715 [Cognatiyoonia koreensis]
MFRRPLAPWRKIIPTLQTGDLIFFRGRGWQSRVIEMVTGGVWSHVAMVVEPRDIDPETIHSGLYLWESTTIGGFDIKPGHRFPDTGPMLVDLEKRLEDYFEKWGYYLLSARYLHVERTQEMRTAMAAFINDPEIRDSTYPETSHLMWYYFRERYLTARDEGSFFCSELIAATYQAGGLLPDTPSATSYCPRDFSESGFIPRLCRAELGEEVYMAQSTER